MITYCITMGVASNLICVVVAIYIMSDMPNSYKQGFIGGTNISPNKEIYFTIITKEHDLGHALYWT